MEPHHYFNIATLPLYLVGFLTFVTTLIDDWLNPEKRFRKVLYYVQEFLYTLISIALGISICLALETSQSISWVVSIIMGLCGSSIIRAIRNKRGDIGDTVVEKIKNTILNPTKKTYDSSLNSQKRGDKVYQSYDDVCADEGWLGDDDNSVDDNNEPKELEQTPEERMKEKFSKINSKKIKI